MLRTWSEWRSVRRFLALPPAARSITFYAEDRASWVHLGPLVEELLGRMNRPVTYLTSDPNDPVLDRADPGLETFAIGEGAVRTWLFLQLRCDVMVMTMPDLESLQIKRSKVRPVHYAYVFHSLVSTHMIYRPGAFDHYDTILCAGPHHVKELRAAEAEYGLPERNLVEHGYGRLDSILREAGSRAGPSGEGPLRVLIAPSWHGEGLIETRGAELVQVLLEAGFHVTARPHPVTGRRWPDAIARLREFSSHPRFELETDVASQESLHASHLMISDWSGAALEYAFGLERPVLFVDVARKVNNEEYERLPCEPLEVSIRSRIGEIVAPDRLQDVPDAVRRLCAEPETRRDTLRRIRAETVFHVGESAGAGAEAIAALAERSSSSRSE